MSVFENLLVGAMFGAGLREAESAAGCMETLELTGLAARGQPAGRQAAAARSQAARTGARAGDRGRKLLLLDEIAGGLTEARVRTG